MSSVYPPTGVLINATYVLMTLSSVFVLVSFPDLLRGSGHETMFVYDPAVCIPQ